MVLARNVAEIVVGDGEGTPQNDYLAGPRHQLGGMIPDVDGSRDMGQRDRYPPHL